MKKVINSKELERCFRERYAKLNSLIDQDPQSAIDAAYALSPDEVLNTHNIDALRAGILIDAGSTANNVQAVDDGIALLQLLLNNDPNRGDLQYCLANGFAGKADLTSFSGPEWYCKTADLRRKARYYFRDAVEGKTGASIASQAFTNLGNSLIKAYRFIEAYDSYLSALNHEPTNGIALTGATKILLRFADEGTGDRDVLLGVAARHLKTAKANPERIRELAGERAYADLSKLLEVEIIGGAPPDLTLATDYQRFVSKHRLALTPTLEGLDLALPRWDSLRIESITEHINAGHGIPPIFAMFNVLKSDYLTARYFAYLGLTGENIADSGQYTDTLDYACYGIKYSMLTLAQRSCIDILDKVAIAVSEYLCLPGNLKKIDFQKRWFLNSKKEEPLTWQPEVYNEIILGNTALIAITEVSYDIAEGGFLHNKKCMRNTSTHRFIVLHDIEKKPSRECQYIGHDNCDAFEGQLIETFQLTRAVLFYFVEMIKLREKRLSNDGTLRMPLFVPDHNWIRGE